MADLKKIANVAVNALGNAGVGTKTATTIVSGAAHFAKGVVNLVNSKKDKIIDTVKEIGKDIADTKTNPYEKALNIAEDLGADKAKVHSFVKATLDDPSTPIKTVVTAVKDEVNEIKTDAAILKQAQAAGMPTADARKAMDAKHPEIGLARKAVTAVKVGAAVINNMNSDEKRVGSSKKVTNVNAVINHGDQISKQGAAQSQEMVAE